MQAILYTPYHAPQPVAIDGLVLPDVSTELVQVPEHVSALLGCTPTLVDVLVSAPRYIVYSVFDYDGEINHTAMEALTKLTSVRFGENEDNILRGAVLVVQY